MDRVSLFDVQKVVANRRLMQSKFGIIVGSFCLHSWVIMIESSRLNRIRLAPISSLPVKIGRFVFGV
jgi:hypothetical protein